MHRYAELDDAFYAAMAAARCPGVSIETGEYEAAFEYGLGRSTWPWRHRHRGRNDRTPRGRIPFLLLGPLRPAAILEGAFDALCGRYGISTPPAFTPQARRLWPDRKRSGTRWARRRSRPWARSGKADARGAGGPGRKVRGSRTAGRRHLRDRARHRLACHERQSSARALSSTPESPAPSPRTPSSRTSATSTAGRSPASARVFEAVGAGRGGRPASSRSRTSSTAPCARTTTCCWSTT